ncbi:hypothetical protein LJ739_12735 [Aestuariibacter halophilus]|uniref:Metallo-beta-lactamase domain-containing protein n=1 Tax=Fluctibacter halophilus TaxID=226011 RepID=A0ABS8GAC7_9ALTE|nr:MBL fold metallo-hydrolase [Aestuariibacter halophilus]MCC2617111.1 hypothetical protein [Aestuariibacter halophilus]
MIWSTPVSATGPDLSDFSSEKVNQHVYVMVQDYGDAKINFAVLVGHNDVVLITTMMKEFNPHVEALIRGISDKPVGYVVSIDGDYYHYYGSRKFVEGGATLIAHKNLIPDVFDNRVLVDEPYRLDVGTEQLHAIPTRAHTLDHMMVKLDNSNVVFAGDALSFDWIVYSGPNGPDAHITALQQMLAQGDKETRFYPGNWVSQQYGSKQDVQSLIRIYSDFVSLVRTEYQQGKSAKEIAQSPAVHDLLEPLKDYHRQKPYIINYVKDVLGQSS